MAVLHAALETDMPTGDVDYEPQPWTVDELVAREEAMLARGLRMLTAAARDPSGRVVAYTELLVPGHGRNEAIQNDTLVHRAHRGHRLGVALKVVNLRRLRELYPEVPVVHTWSADDNAPMLAVNEAVGFRQVEWEFEYQVVT